MCFYKNTYTLSSQEGKPYTNVTFLTLNCMMLNNSSLEVGLSKRFNITIKLYLNGKGIPQSDHVYIHINMYYLQLKKLYLTSSLLTVAIYIFSIELKLPNMLLIKLIL